jgi:hypothetical protein
MQKYMGVVATGQPKHRHSLRNGVNGLSRAHPEEAWLGCLRRRAARTARLGTCHLGVRPARFSRPRMRRPSSKRIRVHHIPLHDRDDAFAPLAEAG